MADTTMVNIVILCFKCFIPVCNRLVPIPDDPVEMPLYPLYYIKYSGVGKPFHFSVIR